MTATDTRLFHPHYRDFPSQQRRDLGRSSLQPAHGAYSIPFPHGQPSPFNMAQIGGVLPDYRYPQRQQYPHQMQTGGPPPITSMSTPAVVYQLQQTLQYPLDASYVHPPGYVSYPHMQYAPGYAQSPGISQSEYAPYEQGQHRRGVMAHGPQYTHNPGQYYYYQDAYWRPVGSLTGSSSQHAQFPRVMGPGQPGMPNSKARRPSRGPIYDGQYIGDISKIL
jgi:hypothetical protein